VRTNSRPFRHQHPKLKQRSRQARPSAELNLQPESGTASGIRLLTHHCDPPVPLPHRTAIEPVLNPVPDPRVIQRLLEAVRGQRQNLCASLGNSVRAHEQQKRGPDETAHHSCSRRRALPVASLVSRTAVSSGDCAISKIRTWPSGHLKSIEAVPSSTTRQPVAVSRSITECRARVRPAF